MKDRPVSVPITHPTGALGDFTGGVVEALLAAVHQVTASGELTMIEDQVRVLEPSLIGVAAMTLTAQCLRRGTNVVFARGEVTSSDGRLVALASATFVHTA